MLEVHSRWFAELDAHRDRISPRILKQWLDEVGIPDEVIQERLRFHPARYVRNLLYAGPTFHALLLCWRNGQRSPIHDHRGSSCGVKVLRGTAIETVFERAPNGMVFPVGSRTRNVGTVFASEDADIHQVANLQAADADLVTLHIYSPPLHQMNVYSLDDPAVRRIFDPINDEFVSGGGI